MSNDAMLRYLLPFHGPDSCHICGHLKVYESSSACSYPHGRLPTKVVNSGGPEEFWIWELPTTTTVTAPPATVTTAGT